MHLAQETTGRAGNRLENFSRQGNNKALGSGPDPARMPRGHGIPPAAQGAPSAALGNLSTEVTPPHELIVSRRKDAYSYRYGHYALLSQWEVSIKAEVEAIVRGVKSSPESLGDVAERLSELSEELALVNHTSRWCMRSIIPSEGRTKEGQKYKTGCPGHAEIHTGYQGDTKTAHWVYVRGCGSPFFCLGCAPKIYAVRRAELTKLFDYCRENGHSFFFATFTHPHTNKQPLKETMAALAIMRRKLRSGAPWDRFKKKWGIFGAVVTLEITYSDYAGWHPHFHMAFATARPGFTEEEKDAIQRFLMERWNNLCVKYGLITDEFKRQQHMVHGVRVQVGTDQAQLDYLAKTEVWEMASTTTKTPKRTDSLSPWEIARRAQAGEPKYKALWFDFMRSMKGRVAVQWSHGLKALVGVKDIEDEEIVQGKEAVLVAVVPQGEFSKINRRRLHHEVLSAAEKALPDGGSVTNSIREECGIVSFDTIESKEKEREDKMKLYQIDVTMASIQEEIDWIEECGVMQDIPLPKKMEMIRRRQELQEELDMLAEGKAMLQ